MYPFLIGISHHKAPLEIRERFALSDADVAHFYKELLAQEMIEECMILNTCNRVEVYGIANTVDGAHRAKDFFCELEDVEPTYFDQYAETKEGNEAWMHLFRVASGLDSQMVGETEILGQVKAAFAQAQEQKYVSSLLNRAFQKSFQHAKWIRTNTGIGKGQVSIGNIAAELAMRIFGELEESRILMLGTGEVAVKTLEAVKSRGGSSITVASRTLGKARMLASQYDGVAVDLEQISSLLRYFDIVISATSSRHAILTEQVVANAMKSRPEAPLFLIDQAVPRDIEQSVDDLTNVYLYNLDNLAAIANENMKARKAEIKKCETFLKEKVEQLDASFNRPQTDAQQEG